MKKIKLTQGKYALVDNEDFEKLMDYKWCANKGWKGNTFYALSSIYNPKTQKSKAILMHRVILNLSPKTLCDHINQNGLDNRKRNLRICSKSQNAINSKLRKDNKTGHRGVTWEEKRGKWTVRARFENRYLFLGRFINKYEAIQTYKRYAQKNHGQFYKNG